jgi:hypothetical protein
MLSVAEPRPSAESACIEVWRSLRQAAAAAAVATSAMESLTSEGLTGRRRSAAHCHEPYVLDPHAAQRLESRAECRG